MAVIKPFAGIRYDPKKVEMDRVVTPPYDVISSQDQEEYYRQSEHNFVRLILGKQSREDTSSNNRYTRAHDYLGQWVRERVLVQDKKQSLYVYQQQFNGKTRRGFIGLMRLEDFSTGIVIPHERTLSGPKADRLELMRATKANLGLVFLVYSDPEMRVDGILKNVVRSSPIVDLRFRDGIRNSLWVIDEAADIESIRQMMEKKVVYIADGHHRYETCLAYRDEIRAKGEHAANYGMMAFFNMDDPGLEIYPTHRLIYNLKEFNPEALLRRLADYFVIETQETRESLFLKMKSEGKHCFGLFWTSHYVILKLKDEDAVVASGDASRSRAWNLLDVSILHSLVIEKLLGIDRLEEHVRYTRSDDEALRAVEEGTYQLAFLLNPTSIEEFKDIAARRERMPQKSTYFYPKLLSGLVIYRFE